MSRIIGILFYQVEPGEEAERPASTEISLLSKWYKQTAKWSHHGANPAEVLRQEIWDVASPGDTARHQ